MKGLNLEGANDIRTERQAAESGDTFVAEFQEAIKALTSGAGVVTSGTRADRATYATTAANELFIETDTGWLYRWGGTSWAFVAGLNYGTNAAKPSVTAADDGAWYLVTDADTNNGLWRVVSGAWAKQHPPSTLSLVTALKVGANQVIGARGAAVNDVASPDATDLATALTLANETKVQLNALLARVRAATGHGLIS